MIQTYRFTVEQYNEKGEVVTSNRFSFIPTTGKWLLALLFKEASK